MQVTVKGLICVKGACAGFIIMDFHDFHEQNYTSVFPINITEWKISKLRLFFANWLRVPPSTVLRTFPYVNLLLVKFVLQVHDTNLISGKSYLFIFTFSVFFRDAYLL
jgi:hypothetical protein